MALTSVMGTECCLSLHEDTFSRRGSEFRGSGIRGFGIRGCGFATMAAFGAAFDIAWMESLEPVSTLAATVDVAFVQGLVEHGMIVFPRKPGEAENDEGVDGDEGQEDDASGYQYGPQGTGGASQEGRQRPRKHFDAEDPQVLAAVARRADGLGPPPDLGLFFPGEREVTINGERRPPQETPHSDDSGGGFSDTSVPHSGHLGEVSPVRR